jgi:hypothetical protein
MSVWVCLYECVCKYMYVYVLCTFVCVSNVCKLVKEKCMYVCVSYIFMYVCLSYVCICSCVRVCIYMCVCLRNKRFSLTVCQLQTTSIVEDM